ncbi:hypothetical protein AB5J62_28015 [Amycolatopsis sp. cg5]|uniref:hypothetical protein n=1 Tax=Amycolatopsis sp. cg5 TaxID=3238802 RepID=UPI00352626DC
MLENLGKATRLAVAGLAVVGGTAAMTGPAAAAPSNESTIQGCSSSNAAVPWQSGSEIVTTASSSGCDRSWHFQVLLERESWRGWITERNPSWDGDGSATPKYPCGGMGTYNYRTTIYKTNPAGTVFTSQSGVARYSC